MTLQDRFWRWLAASLASVQAVEPGRDGDGLTLISAGAPADRDWSTLLAEFNDAREAFDKNPLARRLVLLTVAYVVGGQGIDLSSDYGPLQKLIGEFSAANRLALKQADWCEELARSGELFISLHMGDDGVPLARAKPANEIREIRWLAGDYETETEFVEGDGISVGRRWRSAWTALQGGEAADTNREPIMMHYAVNRPVGRLRGQSDLASVLPWLRRYSRWLDDRVRLNAAMRAFLWIVRAPGAKLSSLAEKYRTPPESGSVIIVDRDVEEWVAVTPDIKAADAERDGRAIRWMIVAGGPGTALTDVGEAETANLATAEAMGEQRRRFLRQRQMYFGWALADVVVQAFNWSVRLGLRRGRVVTAADVRVKLPDLAPSDNAMLAGASKGVAEAFQVLQGIVGDSPALRRMAVETMVKFAGESVDPAQVQEMIGGMTDA